LSKTTSRSETRPTNKEQTMTSPIKKNDKVKTRINHLAGVVIDCEDDVQFGWAYQVRFDNGVTKWMQLTDLYLA
jgi:hypothetical protein